MKGNILTFDKLSNTGFISGHDGKRYTFCTQSLAENIVPNKGMEVDFEQDGESAKSIIFLSRPVIASETSRIAYILLAIFLGVFGVHNFYAGYIGKAVAQLLITLLSLGFLSIVSFIWAVVEAIVIDKDAKGNPMV